MNSHPHSHCHDPTPAHKMQVLRNWQAQNPPASRQRLHNVQRPSLANRPRIITRLGTGRAGTPTHKLHGETPRTFRSLGLAE